MKYKMQVLVETDSGKEWRDVRPTNGQAYTYATESEAQKILAMCYPECTPSEARVIKSITNGE